MGFYISAKSGGYYEGDRAHWRDSEVPKRPSPNHQWFNDEWIYVEPPAPEPTEFELLQTEITGLKARLDKAEADIEAVKVDVVSKEL